MTVTIELTLYQLSAVVISAVVLAVTDGAAISRLGVAWTAKKVGLKPAEIMRYERATDGDGDKPE